MNYRFVIHLDKGVVSLLNSFVSLLNSLITELHDRASWRFWSLMIVVRNYHQNVPFRIWLLPLSFTPSRIHLTREWSYVMTSWKNSSESTPSMDSLFRNYSLRISSKIKGNFSPVGILLTDSLKSCVCKTVCKTVT